MGTRIFPGPGFSHIQTWRFLELQVTGDESWCELRSDWLILCSDTLVKVDLDSGSWGSRFMRIQVHEDPGPWVRSADESNKTFPLNRFHHLKDLTTSTGNLFHFIHFKKLQSVTLELEKHETEQNFTLWYFMTQ